MKHASWLPRAATVSLALLAFGCGGHPRPQVPKVAALPSAPVKAVQPPPAPEPPDPVAELVKTSEEHFNKGRQQFDLGHLDQAKVEFNRSLGVLLESSYGARADSRLRQHFDRLVDRISALEMAALAEGDGFTEKKYEPASIDELLAMTTFERPAPPGPELQQTVQDDLKSTDHDIPIPFNQRVLSYVDLFQGRLRDYLQDGIERGAKYLPMIQSVFRAEGLPLDLAYVPLIESAFKPNALSRAKAKGVWQFMKGTALENGLHHDWYIDERSDPEKATVAAAKYLKTLVNLFGGDWHLALASYNGGPGRVQRALKRSGLGDFWRMSSTTRYLPRETREYVPMILAAIIIAKNPLQYGFQVPVAEPVAYDKVEMPRAIDLRRVAEWTGASIDEIQALNPELRRWTTPVKYPNYSLKVPLGTAEVLRAKLAQASASDLASFKWHTVRKGESLATVARKLRVRRVDLAEANNLSVRSRIRAGQALIIPRAPSAVLAAHLDNPAPKPEPIAASRRVAAAADTPAGDRSELARLVYRVKSGDTLFSIARVFKTTVAHIKSWNRLRGSRINPGDRLTIFASRRLGSLSQ